MALFTLNINIYVPITSDGTNPTDTETNSSTCKVLAETTLSCSHSGNSAFHESTIKRKPFRFWTTVYLSVNNEFFYVEESKFLFLPRFL